MGTVREASVRLTSISGEGKKKGPGWLYFRGRRKAGLYRIRRYSETGRGNFESFDPEGGEEKNSSGVRTP